MRRFLLITVALALCATAALAGNPPKGDKGAPGAAAGLTAQPAGKMAHPGGHGPGMHKVLNNVIRMDANGDRTALCLCGMEVKVTDQSPVWEHAGTTFYMCSEGCKSGNMGKSPEDLGKTLAAWREKYHGTKLASNAVEKDGRRTAVCACGKSFEVTDASPVVIENGVRMYCCSEACHEHLMKMTSAERIAAEAKFARGAAKM